MRAAAQTQLNTRGKSFPGLIWLQDFQINWRQTPCNKYTMSRSKPLLLPMYFVTHVEGGRDSITVTSGVTSYPLLAVLTSRFRRQARGWNTAASWCDAFPCLSRRSRDSPAAFKAAADPFRGLPEPFREDHKSGVLCGLHGPPGKGAGCHTADRRFVFMLLLLSFGFASAVTEQQTAHSFSNPGFTKPPASCRVGRSPPSSVRTPKEDHILQEGCGSL